jgi:precorrin-2 dehydrogenase/sirohydrochlorin ferrochelatase
VSPNGERPERFIPYSISLNLEGAKCLVVGGGNVAFRKVESLMESGATVKVVSPEVVSEIETLDGVEIIQQKFHVDDLEGMFLVISATDNREVNEQVAGAARERGMLVNVVDVPDLCNFYVNAQVRRGDLTISVSTGGASPAMARRIREELEDTYGAEYAEFLTLMREYRPVVIDRVPDLEQRTVIFKKLANAGIEKIYGSSGETAARKAIEEIIDAEAGASEELE